MFCFVLGYFEEEHEVLNTFWQELMQLIGPVAIFLPELPDERLQAFPLLWNETSLVAPPPNAVVW